VPAGNAVLSVFPFLAGLLPLLKRGVDIQGGGPRSFCYFRRWLPSKSSR
jgi:hypothetical protein